MVSSSLSQPELVAKEERAYRNWAKKCTEAEEREGLLNSLLRSGVGLPEVENFARQEVKKMKGGGKMSKIRGTVSKVMKDKLLDNSKWAKTSRRMRDKKRMSLEKLLGKNSKVYREIVKNVKLNCDRVRRIVKKKYVKKARFLAAKYGKKRMSGMDDMTSQERMKYGNARIFLNECDLKPEEIKGPVIVCMEGEQIELSDDERSLLSLGPKFSMMKSLRDEDFDASLEEALMKFKWDCMSDKNEKVEMSDIALDVLLREICTPEEYEEIKDDEVMKTMRMRMVYDGVDGRLNLAKKRVTDAKGNSRVNFPKEGGDEETEAVLEMMRLKLKEVFKNYCVEKCLKGGTQKSNLTEGEMRGLKSLRKRVGDSELVIIPTDKSGRFAVMSLATYELAGQAHTKKDEVMTLSKVKSTQTELNGHVSMLMKIFKIGAEWGHTERFRETMLTNSLSVCPLYLLYKDHKGRDLSKGPVPPTRPVASGNRGMNMNMSEILSDILEPIADGVEDSYEVISTEDMVARMIKVDRSLENWDENSWWEGVKYGKYMACVDCKGDMEYKLDLDNPELCVCENVKDLLSPTDVVRTSVRYMELMRQRTWSMLTDTMQGDDKLDSNEVRNEMIQDLGAPMEMIGFDVDALYPSLDWENTEEVIGESIRNSNIVFEDVDILEGCRYIALNWSGEKCRQSPLSRVLPVRRARTGTRPGITGTGPLGPEIHDQEQWRFPDVVITEDERRAITATVISIAVKELFSNHLYTFGGRTYKQSKGGAIGLRATCAIARVVMNMWDDLWTQKLRDLNIRVELYTRYMDDGRAMIHPIRPGWRVCEDGGLRFCKAWFEEDRRLSSTERTKRVLGETMRGVMRGINMTMETKDDFCGEYLPTLDVNLAITPSNRLKFKHFEKPTSSNLTLQKRTAMEENSKIGILGNEVVRRMFNTWGEGMDEVRTLVIDNYAVKILTSGYSVEQTRRIILSGLRGYEAKVRRRTDEGVPLYRTSKDSGTSRAKKKILGKSTWFKGGTKKGPKVQKRGNTGVKRKRGDDEDLRTRSVMFVNYTGEGEMAKRLRLELGNMENLMGFRMKVIERTGTKLKDLFSPTNIWKGSKCEREGCTTCSQGGEDLPDCKRRSIVYESICTKCNPGAKETGPLRVPETDVPSIYVGESARSIYERAGEHWRAYYKKNPDSHIWKHHLIHHGGEGEPEMRFKVLGNFRTAITRQITEAIRIRKRGASVLNSRGEYDRIHCLTIGSDLKPDGGITPTEKEGDNKEDWMVEQLL